MKKKWKKGIYKFSCVCEMPPKVRRNYQKHGFIQNPRAMSIPHVYSNLKSNSMKIWEMFTQ